MDWLSLDGEEFLDAVNDLYINNNKAFEELTIALNNNLHPELNKKIDSFLFGSNKHIRDRWLEGLCD